MKIQYVVAAVIGVFLTVFIMLSPNIGADNGRFTEADKLFLERSDPSKAQKALSLYREYYASHKEDADAAWRVSMSCYFAGFEIAKSKQEKKRLFAEGRDSGLAAVKLNPDSAEANFWTAVNMALYGETVGVLKMLFTLGAVRGYLAKSAVIDPAYAYGGAYRILGKIEQELPGILGGSNERAKDYYLKAISIAPDEPLNYYFLADLQHKAFRDNVSAARTVERGLALPIPDPSRHESLWGRGELVKFRERLK